MEKFEELSDRLSNAEYWRRHKECSDELATAKTVDVVIETCGRHFGRSAEDAFYPGGSDEDLAGILVDAGWSIVWMAASYYFAAREPGGENGLTYIEGDIARGIQRRI